ncbi:MAG TPA: ATPase [Elusimicrobia bacterium]|nr:ATPase [Elusimicrobiota bacterium]
MDKKVVLRDFSLLIALLLIGGFFSIMSPQFLGARNLAMLMIELSITATLALGMILVILPGHIDLSVGSGVGLVGGIASVLVFQQHWPSPLAMALAAAFGILLWLLMGWVIVRERMPAFIITLGGLLIFKGAFWLVIRNATVPVAPGGTSNLYSLLTTYYLPSWGGALLGLAVFAGLAAAKLRTVARRKEYGFPVEEPELLFLKLFLTGQGILLFVVVMNQFRGIPLTAMVLGLVLLVVTVLTEHTPFGRYLYAIGGNEEAAVISGIPVNRVIIGAYGILGAIVAVTGFMQTAYSGASTTTVGDLMELDAIAACVIGGVSLKGGRGTTLGVIFGALIMAALLNGMTLLAVSPEYKLIARGAVLALAVWMDVRLSRD